MENKILVEYYDGLQRYLGYYSQVHIDYFNHDLELQKSNVRDDDAEDEFIKTHDILWLKVDGKYWIHGGHEVQISGSERDE